MTSERRQVVKAMAVIRRPGDGALLVSEHESPAGDPFHRPLGGHVDFGEYAEHTLHREFGEELGQELTGARLLGVVENIFDWDGSTQHEIVFLFTASFADGAAYAIEKQRILDQPDDDTIVIWRPAGATSPPLYPAGIENLIPPV